MITSATRSRIFELRRDRAAAHRSAELLDRKREVLLREIARRERRRAALRASLATAYAEAHRRLRVACIDLGIRAVEAAALAQPTLPPLATRLSSIMGTRIVHLAPTLPPWRAHYGAASTSASLDDAGLAFAAILPLLFDVAQEESALARLRAGMRKTGKLLNALRKVVLPRIEREIRAVVDGIEEEERDESLRRRRARVVGTM
jgi:V/A-type H+-transporting ATPase subunit D